VNALPDDDFVRDLLKRALDEDLGRGGDVTSHAIFAAGQCAEAAILAKEAGVLSGAWLIAPLYAMVDPAVAVESCAEDGNRLARGSCIARIRGPVRGILAGERVILNFLQRMSGIATATAALVAAVSHTDAVILDTRKTTPTLRPLERRAVRDGGGRNHRFGLYDMVLIKDTHVRASGGVANAIRAVRRSLGCPAPVAIEAEVQSYEEFLEALAEKPDRIMLDNMSCEQMGRCVDHARATGSSIELEASGNVSLETVAAIAETGVGFISSGAITHSAKALDIHLKII